MDRIRRIDITEGMISMPRMRREKDENGTYHIIVRGNNQQSVFFDDQDRNQYLKTLKRYKEKYQVKVYAYCLMTNHIHLLVFANGQDISKFMQGLSLSYVIYFNRKYGRIGHLFQDRFNSILVRNDNYFIYVSKYIHLNPVKAIMVDQPRKYKWSSYKYYVGQKDVWEIIDSKVILAYFSKNEMEAKKQYRKFVEMEPINEVSNELESEVAITSEEGIMKSQISDMNRFNKGRVLSLLEAHFFVELKALQGKNIRKYKVERAIFMYMLMLIEKLSYKEIGNLFGVTAESVGYNIKKVVDQIVNKRKGYMEIKNIIKSL